MFEQALAAQAASDLRLSSSLLLPLPLPLLILFSSASLSGFHLACTSTSLGAISLRFHPASFHAAVCCQARGSYIVPGGGTNLVVYTVNRFYGFVFVFLSYSSYSSYSSSSPSFLFYSLAGFHLECTSNSLGATSLWPAGLPKAHI